MTEIGHWLPRHGHSGRVRGGEALSEVMDMLIISTVVMVSGVCKYFRTYQTVNFNMCHMLYVNYNLMLFLKGKMSKKSAAFSGKMDK